MSKKEEMAKRVDEAKKKLDEERQKILATAPELTEKILQGVDVCEEVAVKLKDGTGYKVKVHALGEGQLLSAMQSRPTINLSNLTIRDYEVFLEIAAKSTGLSRELLEKSLAFGESMIISSKCLELSGIGEGAKVNSFRKSD